jgi:hypothetical protein
MRRKGGKGGKIVKSEKEKTCPTDGKVVHDL